MNNDRQRCGCEREGLEGERVSEGKSMTSSVGVRQYQFLIRLPTFFERVPRRLPREQESIGRCEVTPQSDACCE